MGHTLSLYLYLSTTALTKSKINMLRIVDYIKCLYVCKFTQYSSVGALTYYCTGVPCLVVDYIQCHFILGVTTNK